MKTNASISSLENENIAIQNILIEIHAAAVNVEKKLKGRPIMEQILYRKIKCLY